MTYNKSEIMKAAWADFNKRNADYAARGLKRRDSYKNCLALAWSRAKADKVNNEIRRIEHEKNEIARIERERIEQEHKNWLKKTFPDTEIGRLKKDLFYLEMKDRWTEEDYILARKMQEEIKRLQSYVQYEINLRTGRVA